MFYFCVWMVSETRNLAHEDAEKKETLNFAEDGIAEILYFDVLI